MQDIGQGRRRCTVRDKTVWVQGSRAWPGDLEPSAGRDKEGSSARQGKVYVSARPRAEQDPVQGRAQDTDNQRQCRAANKQDPW